MTKKDYELIAETIRPRVQYWRGISSEVVEEYETLIDNLAKKLHQDNPRFNGHTFRLACGMEI